MNERRSSLGRQILIVCLLLAGIALCTWLLNVCYHCYLSAIYPMEYSEEVQQVAETFDLQPSLIYAIIHTESGFDPDAVSYAEAKGLMQLTDDTYRWALSREGNASAYDAQNLFDPATNIYYGVYVLSLLREQFPHMDTMLAAYNAGQGRVRVWLKDSTLSSDGKILRDIPYPETKEYIRRVREAQERYRRLYRIS